MRFGLRRPPASCCRSSYLHPLLLLLPLALLLGTTLRGAGRYIPDDVHITAYLKPSGNRLRLLIRVPFAALNEIQFPIHSDTGFMYPEAAESMLPGAARYWVANSLDFYEAGDKLPKPQIVAARVSLPTDRSFDSFDQAMAEIQGPKVTGPVEEHWSNAWFDVLLEYPIHSDRSAFSLRPRVAHLGARVSTKLTFLPPPGENESACRAIRIPRRSG